jgi:hypothetical protein
MKHVKFTGLVGLAAAALIVIPALTGCTETEEKIIEVPTPTPVSKFERCLVPGTKNIQLNITDDCELGADSTYNLQGLTFVKFGTTLTIGAGATIKGKSDGTLAALIVEKGGILNAVGTASKPIVFTAGTSAPVRSDFGGVVILGRAPLNVPNSSTDIEGLVGVPYGGTDVADSSGVLKYVRIEFAGRLLGTDNELNGLTMGGVGSKTEISYIHQREGLDDCFEWFGGTVSASYLVATGCDDDMFDYDLGWSGTLQFGLGAHVGVTNTDANGIEADGRNGAEESLPRTNPNIANITLIGTNVGGGNSMNGMRLRRGVAGHIYNSIVTGFGKGTVSGAAIRIDGNTSIRLVNNDSLKGYSIVAYNNGSRVNVSPAAGLADSVATRAAAITKVGTWFHSDTTNLNITLAAPKPASTPTGTTLPTGKGFTAVTFIGAFDPAAATLWTAGGWMRGY